MVTTVLASILAVLLTLLPQPQTLHQPPKLPPDGLLAARADLWPHWQLPAPLGPVGLADLVYPAWFAGRWDALNWDLDASPADAPELHYPVRFRSQTPAGVVGDRAFNAEAVGAALLGDQLLSVDNDPANPNRQLARLRGDQWLESTVVARRSASNGDRFEADELTLQVLHGPGAPRVSRVETLSRYRREADGSISGEQWQATYPSPAEGLVAQPLRTGHFALKLRRPGPESRLAK